MKDLMKEPSRVVILGAGPGGVSMLELMMRESLVEVVAVADRDPHAPGLKRAAELDIPVYSDVGEALRATAPCIAFNLTADETAGDVASGIPGVGVVGGMEADLIWKIVTNMHETRKRLEYQATHDELTQLYNRHHMISVLERELSLSIRYDVPLSVVLIDLDKFKTVNDVYGHATGDAALRHVAELLRKHARVSDVIGRWGGEEFVALLPHNDIDSASLAVTKWLDCLRQKPFVTPAGKPLEISFSAGIAGFKRADASGNIREVIDRILARADDRLYVAKSDGRGRIISSG